MCLPDGRPTLLRRPLGRQRSPAWERAIERCRYRLGRNRCRRPLAGNGASEHCGRDRDAGRADESFCRRGSMGSGPSRGDPVCAGACTRHDRPDRYNASCMHRDRRGSVPDQCELPPKARRGLPAPHRHQCSSTDGMAWLVDMKGRDRHGSQIGFLHLAAITASRLDAPADLGDVDSHPRRAAQARVDHLRRHAVPVIGYEELDHAMRQRLDALLTEKMHVHRSRVSWLREPCSRRCKTDPCAD